MIVIETPSSKKYIPEHAIVAVAVANRANDLDNDYINVQLAGGNNLEFAFIRGEGQSALAEIKARLVHTGLADPADIILHDADGIIKEIP